MKVEKIHIFELQIPFKFKFEHHLKTRSFSDSIIVKITTDSGVCGYGEGLARRYVTGETTRESTHFIRRHLAPQLFNRSFDLTTCTPALTALASLNEIFHTTAKEKSIVWHAAQSAIELALVDCLLKEKQISLGAIMPPRHEEVEYSGVISSGSLDESIALALRCKEMGLKQIKVKVTGNENDLQRLEAIRSILGDETSIRLDANGAFSPKQAIAFSNSLSSYKIDSIEQPIPKGNIEELCHVKRNIDIPIMVDESILSMHDAKALAEKNACDYFNLRISKCGGLYNTLKIAEYARNNDIKLQLGAQVGESAILSAAGRHLAATLPELVFIEGSYGTLLLEEDIAEEPIRFGYGGRAPLLHEPGLGITITDAQIAKYAITTIKETR